MTEKDNQFITNARSQGIPDIEIRNFLKKKGVNEQLPTPRIQFFRRLALSFGDEQAQAEADKLEREQGLKGRFELGDIADIGGKSLPFIGGGIGAPAGPVGVGAGTAAGEATKRAIGQALGVRSSRGPLREGAAPIIEGTVAGLGAKAIDLALPAIAGSLGTVFEKGVKKPLKNVIGGTAERIVGSKGARAIATSFAEPAEVGAFRAGQKTIGSLAKEAETSLKGLRSLSLKTFQAAEDKLQDILIDKNKVVSSSYDIVRKAIGLPEGAKLNLSKTGLSDAERKIINNLLRKVDEFGSGQGLQGSTKELLNIRRSIDKGGFYRGDGQHNASDRIVTLVIKNLRQTIADADPAFGQAVSQASKDIELLDRLGYNVLNTSAESVEAAAVRLRQLANDINDPNKREATKLLLEELKARTGYDLASKLESYSAAQNLTGDLPGLSSPWKTINDTLTRFLASGAQTAGEIKNKILP